MGPTGAGQGCNEGALGRNAGAQCCNAGGTDTTAQGWSGCPHGTGATPRRALEHKPEDRQQTSCGCNDEVHGQERAPGNGVL